MEAYFAARDRYVASLPDIVKASLCGLVIDPPTIDVGGDLQSTAAVMDYFVRMGFALVSVEGARRTYHVTDFGAEIYELVKDARQSDASLPANDVLGLSARGTA